MALRSYGIIRDREPTPRSVTVQFADEELVLIDRGEDRRFFYAHLSISESRPGSVTVSKSWPQPFELTITGTAADSAKGHIQPKLTWRRWVTRQAIHHPKFAMLLFGLVLLAVDSLPATFLAAATPASAERRMERNVFRGLADRQCRSHRGKAALQLLVRKLGYDPSNLEIYVTSPDSLLISARPGNRLIVARNAFMETDLEVFAALLAHEMEHLKRREPIRAAARWGGGNYLRGLLWTSSSSRPLDLQYSEQEEQRAERGARGSLIRAKIDVQPVAVFFERSRNPRDSDAATLNLYEETHPVSAGRIALWKTATSLRRTVRPALDRENSDDLFNYCWLGRTM